MVVSALCTPFIVFLFQGVSAQVMGSTNYRIESDSINVGGGYASSTNYQLESTAGEIATGESASSNYKLKAGYQQMHEVYLAMSPAADVTMSPNIGGITGGTANGSTTVAVTTDSAAGYTLTIFASGSPAMQSGVNTIADYTPSGAAPDYTFTTGATDSHFGYSPYGPDTVQRFLDDGASLCNTGSSNGTATCWDGLSTSDATIASAGSANHPNGATTTIYFRLGIGGSVGQPEGVYVATTTLTALAL